MVPARYGWGGSEAAQLLSVAEVAGLLRWAIPVHATLPGIRARTAARRAVEDGLEHGARVGRTL